MECEHWREAISARGDGEDPGIDPRILDAHVRSCAGCRAYERELDAMSMAFRLNTVAAMPDLSRRVVKRVALLDRMSRWGVLRGALAILALRIIFFALPSVLPGGDLASADHDVRHLGSFSIAYAVGLLVVVARPARARTMLPVASVLAGALVLTALGDVGAGRVPLLGEAVHLSEVASVPLVWLLAVPARGGGDTGARGPTSWRRKLRVEGRSDDGHGEQVG